MQPSQPIVTRSPGVVTEIQFLGGANQPRQTEAEKAGLTEENVGQGIGMMQTHFLRNNGPIQPIHTRRRKTMTQAELEQQKAMEYSGQLLPGTPNPTLNEDRMDKLESMVGTIATAVRNLSQTIAAQAAPPGYCPDRTSQDTQPPVPAAPTFPEDDLTGNPSPRTPMGLGGAPSNSEPPQSEPVTSNPTTTMDSPTTEEITGQLTNPNSTLSEPPAKSDPELDPAEQDWPNPEPPGLDQMTQYNHGDVQVSRMVDSVKDWFARKDVHKWFRRLLANNIHQRVAYNDWPPDMRAEFNGKFRELLTNEALLTMVCRKVLRMQTGNAVGSIGLAGLCAAMAGFIAFYTLSE